MPYLGFKERLMSKNLKYAGKAISDRYSGTIDYFSGLPLFLKPIFPIYMREISFY